MYIFLYIGTYIYIYRCIYTYMYTYKHMYTYTHIPIHPVAVAVECACLASLPAFLRLVCGGCFVANETICSTIDRYTHMQKSTSKSRHICKGLPVSATNVYV